MAYTSFRRRSYRRKPLRRGPLRKRRTIKRTYHKKYRRYGGASKLFTGIRRGRLSLDSVAVNRRLDGLQRRYTYFAEQIAKAYEDHQISLAKRRALLQQYNIA